jgi:tetratricopeptide (TPR) repeat protein
MDKALEVLLEAAKSRWHTPSGLFLAELFAFGSLLLFFKAVDLKTLSAINWIIAVVCAFAVGLVWWKTGLPKAASGRVGFGVAIVYETPELGKTLRSDFVPRLRDLLQGSLFKHRFAFLEFPEKVAGRLVTEPDRVNQLMRRCNVHFLLTARAKTRNVNGSPANIIDLGATVRHARLPSDVSAHFSSAMSQAMPGRVIVPEGHFELSEFAATHIDIVARYIIGVAAALSNDLEYASQLLEDAEKKLKAVLATAQAAPLSVLLAKIQGQLTAVYEEQLARSMRRFVFKHEDSGLTEAQEFITRVRRLEPEHYAARLCAAMSAFLLDNNPTEAFQEIAKCKDIDDGAWKYSQAFLHAYAGDLQAAYKAYQSAFRSPLSDPSVPNQCEEFIAAVLSREPKHPQLFFCLGLINYRAKGDLVAARRDFTTFLELASPDKFTAQFAAADRWLAEIDSELNNIKSNE